MNIKAWGYPSYAARQIHDYELYKEGLLESPRYQGKAPEDSTA